MNADRPENGSPDPLERVDIQALWLRFGSDLVNCARKIVKDKEDARDVSQETGKKLVLYVSEHGWVPFGYDPSGSIDVTDDSPPTLRLRAWLLHTTTHLALDLIKGRKARRSREEAYEQLQVPVQTSDPLEDLIRKEKRDLMNRAKGRLSVARQKFLDLLADGAGPAELAEALGCTPDLLRFQKRRALDAFRAAYLAEVQDEEFRVARRRPGESEKE